LVIPLTPDAYERSPQNRSFVVTVPDAIYRSSEPEAPFVPGIEEGELLGQASPRKTRDAYPQESDRTYREFIHQLFGKDVNIVL